jgi:hypothetical protein
MDSGKRVTTCGTCQHLYQGVCLYKGGVRAPWQPACEAYLESNLNNEGGQDDAWDIQGPAGIMRGVRE